MASVRSVPLDDAFVQDLRHRVQTNSDPFTAEGLAHWQAILHHFEGRSDFEIRAYIAQNFRSNQWVGNEPWFDGYTRHIFQRYDRTAYAPSNIPALDEGARSHYNPSNTLGRGHLFPQPPVPVPGASVLNQQQFNALTPDQRQQHQLTSDFGGHRFRRTVDGSSIISAGGSSGVPGNNTSGVGAPPFDNRIADDAVNNSGGNQGPSQGTSAGTNIPGLPIPPFSNQPGNNIQQPGQPGGTTGVPGPLPPTIPTDLPPPPGTLPGNQQGSNTGVPPTAPGGTGVYLWAPPREGEVHYPELVRYPDLPTPPGNPPVNPPVNTPVNTPVNPPINRPVNPPVNPPVTTGNTPGTPGNTVTTPGNTVTTPGNTVTTPGNTVTTPGNTATTPGSTTGTPGSNSDTTGTTPGTSGPKATGTVQTPGGLGVQPPTGPGGPPTSTGGAPGLGVPPLAGPGGTPGGTVPPPAPGGIPPGAPGADGSVPGPLQPSAADLQQSFTWRGQVQPPIGTRLREIIVYLDEGDVDREMYWEAQVREIREFLDWVESGQGPAIGPETALLVQQAQHKLQAHILFEQTHYGPNTPNKIVTADMIRAPEPRLKYNGKLPLVLGRDRKDNEHLQPGDFPTHPRAETVVNDQWLTDVEKRAGLTQEKQADRQAGLSRDEEEWWRLGQGQTPAENNAALRHEQTFEQCIAVDGVGFSGWIDTRLNRDGVTLTRTLFNGDRLGDGKDCYARERAVRRAGLQAALRQFGNHENRVANTPWRRVRLPLSPEEVAVMRKNTGAGPARKYELPKLEQRQLQRTDDKDDPQGFTANMAQFWADRNRDMAAARDAVVSRMGFGPSVASGSGQPAVRPPSVLPPTSLWGAYVDSGLSAENEYHRQMLKEMRTTRKLFEREMKIAPRNLLSHMESLYRAGLRGDNDSYLPVGGQQPRSPVALAERDMIRIDGVNEARDLDKMEIYWIRFLLTQSITPQMTQELEPRASLFILFADKLARIFSDVSDPLFPDNETKVSVEDLLDYIHHRAKGPVQRVKFYAHDVQMWLERLDSQGRCRYQEDWRCYGWVKRPLPTCHPEQLVRWTVPQNIQHLRPNERVEDVSITPRFDRLRNWHSVVRRGLQNNPLDQRVEDYFLCLAYRWGCYMAKLTDDDGLEQQWRTQASRPSGELTRAINDYKNEFDRITQWNSGANNPLVRLVKATLPDRANDNNLTAEASLQLVRDNIIKEAVSNDSVLWPARSANNHLDPLDEKVRPKVWGWARPEVRGKVKRFFSVNRWPVQLQTERRKAIITRDQDINGDFLWKPEVEDPTPAKYYRPKARPYIDEKVQFRSGHRNFLIGDTPRQKQVVIDRMFAQMGRAMSSRRDRQDGDDGDEDHDIDPPGFIERWSTYLLSRFDEEDPNRYEEPGARLRKFHRDDVPQSYDPRAPKRGADGDAAGQGAPKRLRRRGPELGVRGAHDAGDEDVDEDHFEPPPAGAPGADDEGEGSWWDVASMAAAI